MYSHQHFHALNITSLIACLSARRPDEAQPHYKTIKTMYPHYVCSKSNDGVYAYYERPGEIEIEQVCNRRHCFLYAIIVHDPIIAIR